MFKGKKHAIDPRTTDTLIGEGTVFEGKIKSEASIRIEGQITGDVDCTGDVTVGELGVVKSNIIARDVTLAGVVNGNVHCKGKLTIRATGKLYGNTTAQALVIDEGGLFQGMSKMDSSGPPPTELQDKQEKLDKLEQQAGKPFQFSSTAATWQ